jgi:ketosteroid isomerase-like protein
VTEDRIRADTRDATHDPRVLRVRRFFAALARADVARLGEIYAPDAVFKDPFNEVRGVAAIERIFAHMFDQVDAPRFVIHEAIGAGDQAFLTWDFRFRRRGRTDEMTIRGATHLRFDGAGRICLHRDYWDAAEELYEKLPLLGGLMRWLRRRAAS